MKMRKMYHGPYGYGYEAGRFFRITDNRAGNRYAETEIHPDNVIGMSTTGHWQYSLHFARFKAEVESTR